MGRRRVILVGGGLANCLIAYRLSQLRPEAECLIVEPDRLGGNHTWCFHSTDLTAEQRAWVGPFVERHWKGYDIRFPDRTRHVGIGYCCATADRLRTVMERTLPLPEIHDRADAVAETSVTLAAGGLLDGDLVVDGRGAHAMTGWGLAWQAFLGLQVRLRAPHRLASPLIMDATVPQIGGYRFFYCLPFTDDSLLIEDTRYQNGRELDAAGIRSEILAFARSRGWSVDTVEREEHGMLPIVLSGTLEQPEAGPVRVGLRAGLFHPVTGYSLPDAVRVADLIAAQPDLATAAVRPVVNEMAVARWRRNGFYRLLNRMLFMAGAPDERWRILSRFYALPEPLIARFYAGTTTRLDVARILSGRPPVGIARAIACLPASSARGFVRQAAAT